MDSTVWDAELAASYDLTHAGMFDAAVVSPIVDTLVELAAGRPVLEFAVGTGRIALPLSTRGVPVSGIELSPHMAAQLSSKPGADALGVTIGDMTATRVPGAFGLVYLVFNSIMNVTSQDGQIAIFRNAAEHLEPGGYFVVEGGVALGPGREREVFDMADDHIGIDTSDDPVLQLSSSHHWWVVGSRLVRRSMRFRYIYPSEMDLMGRLAGLRLEERWGEWDKTPFTAASTSHVAVFRKPV